MTPTDGLTIVTLVMAIISMILSSIALWPHWKDSLAVVRDGVLWIALILIVVFVVSGALKRQPKGQGSRSHASSHGSVNEADPGAAVY